MSRTIPAGPAMERTFPAESMESSPRSGGILVESIERGVAARHTVLIRLIAAEMKRAAGSFSGPAAFIFPGKLSAYGMITASPGCNNDSRTGFAG
ncbi:hypothetical protein ACFKHW_27905 [Bradyrhizobium lupini]|uniref:hypothetical protein n=1 Tax=Rhizobium lupini TaxID=136996 RepID=UPI0036712209